ncbi:hypothetical protein DNTS_028377 [Danionella cerebrum]|uniref:Uncharacterized protein n=1 Tax=Danionella cerebrum TaxID=2873325 RepID=A0A553MSU4_9TELE|nr:hypothetical protein DNTS_028377 [Danionella translucida]
MTLLLPGDETKLLERSLRHGERCACAWLNIPKPPSYHYKRPACFLLQESRILVFVGVKGEAKMKSGHGLVNCHACTPPFAEPYEPV